MTGIVLEGGRREESGDGLPFRAIDEMMVADYNYKTCSSYDGGSAPRHARAAVDGVRRTP